MTAPLDEIVYRSYIVKYVTRILKYIQAVGEKIGFKEALKIYAGIEWNIGRRWIKENLSKLDIREETPRAALELLKQALRMFDPKPINPAEIKIIEESPNRLVVEKTSWCPILEACRELGLPAEEIYPAFVIENTDAMIKTLNPKLSIRLGGIKPEKNLVKLIIELEE